MKHRELVPVFKQVVEALPSLGFHKNLLFAKPLGGVLRGICFNPSAYNKHDFDVSAFVMPFCFPTTHYLMNFGKDVYGRGIAWSMLLPDLAPRLIAAIREQAMPFLETASTPRDLALALQRFKGCQSQMFQAYALARIGENREAITMIEAYLPAFDPTSHWQKDLADQSRALRHLLLYEPALAATKLEEWETETIHNLGLARFR